MKKVKYAKSLVIASLVVSMALVLFGIYSLLNGGDSIEAIFWIIGGVILGYNDWKIFLTKRNHSL